MNDLSKYFEAQIKSMKQQAALDTRVAIACGLLALVLFAAAILVAVV